jgi:outer membrane protein TolC
MKIYSICFVLFFFHYPIFAEEKPAAPSPHSLEDVTRAVLQNNPTIQQARAEWQAARERVPQAGAWEDPKISASSRLGRFVQMQPNGMVDQELSVEQMIPISGKNRSRARIAAAEAVAAGDAAPSRTGCDQRCAFRLF